VTNRALTPESEELGWPWVGPIQTASTCATLSYTFSTEGNQMVIALILIGIMAFGFACYMFVLLAMYAGAKNGVKNARNAAKE
jgi:hypothetical protein